jgi:HPt (histidine-containing phosphotransfer) domain-containing protein
MRVSGGRSFGSQMIDWQRIKELRNEIGAKDFDEVVALFLEEADEVVARLPRAESASAIESDLHFLKGSALNLGFTDLAQMCQLGERRAAAGGADMPIERVQAVYATSRSTFLAKLAERAEETP